MRGFRDENCVSLAFCLYAIVFTRASRASTPSQRETANLAKQPPESSVPGLGSERSSTGKLPLRSIKGLTKSHEFGGR